MAAWEQAQQISAGATSQQQALEILKRKGINNNFLNKVQGHLNSPMAFGISKMLGVNLENIKNAISSLQGQNSAQPTQNMLPTQMSETSQNNNSLNMLKAGLQQFKH